ncbi:MAG: cytidylate kinase family protein [Syntrophobacteraceae bacterium]|nr:cytidylate kinase family protein [Syntrophobacteraceae bacterium]
MAVITVFREPGTLGKEVAARLAGRLGFYLVDRARLVQLSGEVDLDEARLLKVEEAFSKGGSAIDAEIEGYARLFQDLLAQLAEEQDLVVLESGAQGLFHDRPGTLHVRFVAPRKFRVAQVRGRKGLPERKAIRLIRVLEAERARYLRFLYRLDAADPSLYDLTLRLDRLSVEQALELLVTAVEEMDIRRTPREKIVENILSQPPERRNGGGRFVNEAESEFARFLTFYNIPFQYEPRTFPLETDATGRTLEAFTPDFYLPDQDLYIELTTLKQSLVTRKNRKVRKLRRLYPEINIRIFYQRDFYSLMAKYGLLGETVTDER